MRKLIFCFVVFGQILAPISGMPPRAVLFDEANIPQSLQLRRCWGEIIEDHSNLRFEGLISVKSFLFVKIGDSFEKYSRLNRDHQDVKCVICVSLCYIVDGIPYDLYVFTLAEEERGLIPYIVTDNIDDAKTIAATAMTESEIKAKGAMDPNYFLQHHPQPPLGFDNFKKYKKLKEMKAYEIFIANRKDEHEQQQMFLF
jgi:hypothetical protein